MCIIVIRCSLEYALALPVLVIPKWRMAETLKTIAHISAKTHIGSFQASYVEHSAPISYKKTLCVPRILC